MDEKYRAELMSEVEKTMAGIGVDTTGQRARWHADKNRDLLAEIDRLAAVLAEQTIIIDEFREHVAADDKAARRDEEALERVRAQHFPVDGVYADAPVVCGNIYCRDHATDQFAWPCRTIRAIDGQEGPATFAGRDAWVEALRKHQITSIRDTYNAELDARNKEH